MANLDSMLKSRDITLPAKVHIVKAIHMWELDCTEGWVSKYWCSQIMVLEKTLESPLYCKEIKPVHPKGNQPWIFIGRSDAEAEAPIFWPPDAKSWLVREDSYPGIYEGRRRRGWQRMRWLDSKYHWLNGHKIEQTLGDSEGQGNLVCYSPRDLRVRHDLVIKQQQQIDMSDLVELLKSARLLCN